MFNMAPVSVGQFARNLFGLTNPNESHVAPKQHVDHRPKYFAALTRHWCRRISKDTGLQNGVRRHHR